MACFKDSAVTIQQIPKINNKNLILPPILTMHKNYRIKTTNNTLQMFSVKER